MNKKHTSKEAYFERLRNLADTKHSITESKNRSLGTLINYKRAADGVAYGIIKENHNYYIKKGGLKDDPHVSDFAYIGGEANITNYQYKKLAEATKNINMLLGTINEAFSLNMGNKNKINEDAADQEIDAAEDMLDTLDAATDAEKTETEPGSEMEAGLEAEPVGDEPVGDLAGDGLPPEGMDDTDGSVDLPAETDDELPTELGDEEGAELPDELGDEEGAELPDELGDETAGEEEAPDEIDSDLGKLTHKIGKATLSDAMVTRITKTFLASLKDYFKKLEISDRKEIADIILKVVDDDEIDQLGTDVEAEMAADDGLEEDDGGCDECGGFAEYADSMGYDSAESLVDSGEDSVANLVGNFANHHADGENDGDVDGVSLVIKIVNPEILNTLKNDYGHEEYAEKLEPKVNAMDESPEDNMIKLQEMFGGLKALGKAAGQGIKKGAQAVGSGIANAAQNVGDKVSQAGQQISQTYHGGMLDSEFKKLEKVAANLGKQAGALNDRLRKAGEEEINQQSLFATITAGLQSKGAADLGKFKQAAEGVGVVDPAAISVNENEDEPEIDDISVTTDEPIIDDTNDAPAEEIGFAPEGQPLGGGVVKPDGAETTSVDVNVDAQNKTVNIAMNEGSDKVRKYIRKRLEENAGLRKSSLDENVKSAKLKQLDELIDKKFAQYGKKINEGIFGGVKLPDPTDAAGIEQGFNKAFGGVMNKMGILKQIAAKTPADQKYAILQQYANNKGGTLRQQNGQLVYAGKDVQDKAVGNFHQGQGAMKREGVEEGLFGGVKLPDPTDAAGIENAFGKAFGSIMNKMGILKQIAAKTPIEQKYALLKQYVDNNGGTLRQQNGQLVYAGKDVVDKATGNFHQGQGAMKRE